MTRRYLVKTDHGSVLVEVNEQCRNALDNDLLSLQEPTADNTADVAIEVPLSAFGAKMVEIIDMVGTEGLDASPKVVELMKREKATQELNRIEYWAREHR